MFPHQVPIAQAHDAINLNPNNPNQALNPNQVADPLTKPNQPANLPINLGYNQVANSQHVNPNLPQANNPLANIEDQAMKPKLDNIESVLWKSEGIEDYVFDVEGLCLLPIARFTWKV